MSSATWINLESMLCEISQVQKYSLRCLFSSVMFKVLLLWCQGSCSDSSMYMEVQNEPIYRGSKQISHQGLWRSGAEEGQPMVIVFLLGRVMQVFLA